MHSTFLHRCIRLSSVSTHPVVNAVNDVILKKCGLFQSWATWLPCLLAGLLAWSLCQPYSRKYCKKLCKKSATKNRAPFWSGGWLQQRLRVGLQSRRHHQHHHHHHQHQHHHHNNNNNNNKKKDQKTRSPQGLERHRHFQWYAFSSFLLNNLPVDCGQRPTEPPTIFLWYELRTLNPLFRKLMQSQNETVDMGFAPFAITCVHALKTLKLCYVVIQWVSGCDVCVGACCPRSDARFQCT